MPILAVQRGLAGAQCWVSPRFARVALDAAFPVPLPRSPLVLTTPFWVVNKWQVIKPPRRSSLHLSLSDSVQDCPRNCHGNGECVSGLCHCFPGFLGADCAKGTCHHAPAVGWEKELPGRLPIKSSARELCKPTHAPRFPLWQGACFDR